ncbi:hypothetical protein FACS189454_03730 [Planctomycetales bacterium]|nr:hypothetical protein FACS189454_03730 [Planctomycetales bacterium]
MLKNRRFQFVVVLLIFVLNSGAEEPNVLKTLDEVIPVKTSGGFLFWGDVLFDDSWRIQENIKIHSFRLLDGNFVQRSFGTFEECQNRLNEIKIEKGILPMSGTAVIILHGFGSNVLALQHFGDYLREKKSHDYVFCMSYPSTMQPILEHARMLRRVVEHLPATIRRIDFVGHSLGSIVIRRYLSGPLDDNWTIPDNPAEYRKTFSPDKRIGRFVMIGPPNH